MAILRRRLTRDFTVLPTQAVEHAGLSFRARGVLAFLLAKPDGWRVSAEAIAKASPTEGRTAINTALQELRAAGYYRVHTTRRKDGTLREITDLYDQPQPRVAAEYAKRSEARRAAARQRAEDARTAPQTPSTGSGKPVAGEDVTGDGFPAAGGPDTGPPVPFTSTQSKYPEKNPPRGGRRPPAVGGDGPRGGGTSAPAPQARVAEVQAVLRAFPDALRKALPSPLPRGIPSVLGRELESRTAAQLVERVRRRSEWMVAAIDDGIRAPVGLALFLIEHGECPDPRCEDGESVDDRRRCARCEERRPSSPERSSGVEGMTPTPSVPRRGRRTVAQMPVCGDCRRPMHGPGPLCVDCRQA
ncbi:hypothetical protein [Embleya sp. NPDC059237]|uniref:hypothetical protein n=1 Tax=Embleya sp. NPDC059237 TaxID=3346784 RepID=UPI003686FC97